MELIIINLLNFKINDGVQIIKNDSIYSIVPKNFENEIFFMGTEYGTVFEFDIKKQVILQKKSIGDCNFYCRITEMILHRNLIFSISFDKTFRVLNPSNLDVLYEYKDDFSIFTSLKMIYPDVFVGLGMESDALIQWKFIEYLDILKLICIEKLLDCNFKFN